MTQEPAAAPLVTAAEIARLAGVTRATVSNWRKRHGDFPAPVGGTDSSPAYDLNAVTGWLAANDRLPDANLYDELVGALRFAPPGAAADVLPFVLAALRAGSRELDRLRSLGDVDFDRRCAELVAEFADDAANAAHSGSAWQSGSATTDLRRVVVSCVRAEETHVLLSALDAARPDSGVRGQYATPAPPADLMAELAPTGPGGARDTGFDPACGSGALLGALRDKGVRTLIGQDLLAAQTMMTTARLTMTAERSDEPVHMATGDSLRADRFPELSADVVVCNPPYADSDWGHEELAYDERWVFGVPTARDSELAWLQHCYAHLRPGGRAVVLLPPAVAGRTSGRRIRAELVRRGAVRAVISLPTGTAPPAHIGLQLWVLERAPSTTAPDQVLFIDASRDDHGNAVRLKDATQWKTLRGALVQAWHAFADRPGSARVVPAVELLDGLVDLTPQRQIPAAAMAKSPRDIAVQVEDSLDALRGAAAGLSELADGGAWPAARSEARTWRTATLGDLLKGAALTLERGYSSQATAVRLQEGDVILPEVLRESAGGVRVVGPKDDGAELGPNLLLLRPDTTRLDPDFLAGFLAAPENMRRAVSGTATTRIDVRRLQVPLLPLAEQRRYGAVFQRIRELSDAARAAGNWADRIAQDLIGGLTSGALQPSTEHTQPRDLPKGSL